MLDREQGAYIDGLRTTHPGLDDATLIDTLKSASWSQSEIDEAVRRYQGKITLPPPPPSTPIVKPPEPPTVANSTPAFAPVATVPSPSTPPVSTAVQKPIIENLVAIPEQKSSRGLTKILTITLIVVILCSALGAAGYYIYTKTSLFAPATLTEENILENVIAKLSEIKTTSSELRFDLGVHPREAGAQPFAMVATITPEVRAMYQRDQDRFRDISKIRNELSRLKYAKTPYPVSLSGLVVKTTDPLGVPYVYEKAATGTDYYLTVTFETTEAAAIIQSSKKYSDPYGHEDAKSETQQDAASKTVTINSTSYFSSYKFTGEPEQPKLFGFFELSEVESYIPLGLSINFGTEATIDNSTDAPLNARFRVFGDAVFNDANFAFDAEGMKKGDDYYGVVHKLPSFFSTLSQIRGTWVKFTENDLRNYGYSSYIDSYVPSKQNERAELLEKNREQMKILLDLAKKHSLVRFSTQPIQEKVEGETFTKYQLAIRQEKLLPFYEEATKALESYGKKSILPYDAKTVEYLKGPDFTRIYDYLIQNSSFYLWVDNKGFPARYLFTVRYVPTDKARALKEHQLDFSISMNLRDINKPIEVTAPDTYLSLEDFLVKMTGKTKEELTLAIQTQNVQGVRNALRDYHEWTGKYPDSLSDLEKKRQDVPKSNYPTTNSTYLFRTSDYLKEYPFIKSIPQDVYTKQSFVYTALGGNKYELKYQIKLVPYASNINPRIYYTTLSTASYSYSNRLSYLPATQPNNPPVLVPKFVNGENIANEIQLSQAENDTTDTDKDYVSNEVEKILGTDPMNPDSDNDGSTDREEITTGSNPLGPGALDYKGNYSMIDYF